MAGKPKLPHGRTVRAPLPLSKRKRKIKPLLELNDRHRLFIARYMIHRNATRAFREVNEDKRASQAATSASEWMAQPLIRKEIDRRTKEMLARYAHTAEKVLHELALIAFANLNDLYDEQGRLLAPHDTPREVAAALKARTPNQFGTKIEMHDKVGALTKFGAHYGLFTERVELVAGETMLQLIREGRERSLRKT